MGLIEIEDMEFYAYHGHFKEEQVVGNRFLVSIHLKTCCKAASQSDNLNDALDYQKVYRLVKEEMEIKSHLLEHLTGRILDHLYADFQDEISWAKVKVSKMNPPMGGQIGRVSVTQER
ncbi:dihydroneopterin aldolase [Puteibacter caeruleilacunae]|nr:dihydroneopterin aldolase [Puteibacter caeruleilacunae]